MLRMTSFKLSSFPHNFSLASLAGRSDHGHHRTKMVADAIRFVIIGSSVENRWKIAINC